MIGHFPILYEDELFCSICARLNDHMRYPSIGRLMEDLFGAKKVNRKTYLPSRLDYLISVLPPSYELSADDIIDKLTILPFYSPFLSTDRVNAIRVGMHTNNGLLTKRLGNGFDLPVFVRHLRYCPLCAEEDHAKGEHYWHRIHNIPGVEVCPMHCTWLEETDADINGLVSANQAIRPVPASHLDLSNLYQASLLKIAQDALWLFNRSKTMADLRAIRRSYRFLLYKKGLANYKGVILVGALLQSLIDYFPAELLKQLNCEVNTTRCWVTRLITASPGTMHPVQYLLLMQFLGYTAEDFFALSDDAPFGEDFLALSDDAPFGEGPWPCLNPTSDHYLQKEAQFCHIEYSGVKEKPLKGTFTCHCGFTYVRWGPDSSKDDLLRKDRVKSYGHIWEAALRQLWMDRSISLEQMSHKLGMSRMTVKANAVRLGLPFPQYRGSMKLNRRTAVQASSVFDEKLERYRKAWLSLLQDNPEDNLSQLKRKSPGVLQWLYKHDREWLNQNKPLRDRNDKLPKKTKKSIDWESRDQRLADEVRSSAKRLRTSLGTPVWVTKSAIARDIGAGRFYIRVFAKLPLTASALAEATETREDFAIRKIHWTSNCYRQEGVCPSLSQFILRTGIQRIAEFPRLKEAAVVALGSLSL